MRPHYVYLANASGLKVGITRDTQIPTRWIDQGAVQAILMFSVTSRRLSGLVEVIFKSQVSDRTNWRAMLKGNAAPLDMAAERDRLVSCVQSELANLAEQEGPSNMTLLDEPAITIDYPVQVWPKKVSSHNFDKSEVVSGKLEGIKGQYLLLSNGVINLRKFTSYYVSLNVL